MHAIEARELTKIYGQGESAVHALRGVDLTVGRGEFLSIMGDSGSGKSTMLHLLGLLDEPTSGHVRVAGEDADGLSRNRAARLRGARLGFVFQAFHLLPRQTAIKNVMLPMALNGVPGRDRRQAAERALERVGLGDRMHHKPTELSGGQKQRVAIARALALDPPIILADEPTGNLDSRTSGEVMRLFQELHRSGKTVVQVTHSESLARYGQRIIFMRDGRIINEKRRPEGN